MTNDEIRDNQKSIGAKDVQIIGRRVTEDKLLDSGGREITEEIFLKISVGYSLPSLIVEG